jgi:pimeloyl-ACP methyl ester carboxylesterase
VAAAAGRGGSGVFSVAFSSIEAIFVTLMTSSSSARAQAVSNRAGTVAAGQPEQPVDLPHLRPRQVGVPDLGRDEKVIKLASADWLHQALPSSRLEVFDDSGHCPMWEEPQKFNALVAEWAAQLPGNAGRPSPAGEPRVNKT